MIAVSNNFKNAMKNPVKELDAYIQIGQDRITASDDLVQFKISCESGLCKTAMRKLEAKYFGEHDLLGEWINAGFGVKLQNNTFEYLDYGSFLVSEITYAKDTGITQIVAYDSMIKAMINYTPLAIDYPTNLLDYASAICTACNLTLGNNTFVNANWPVNLDLWENIEGVTYRDIFTQIAQATASTCIIGNDNKVYFKYLTDTEEELTYDNMKKLKLEPIYGEINSVVLGRDPIVGEDVFLKDDESIEENGLTEFRIVNNEIIDKNRENAIVPIYNTMHGISYYPFETSTEGLGWYEIGDSFTIVNDLGEEYKTSLFNFNITVDGGIRETLKSVAETKTQSQYQYASSISKKVKNTEIIVNKQEQVIQALVDNTVYVSNTKSGTGYVTLENAYKGRLYELSIKGQMSLLYPQNDNLYGSSLVPRETLVPTAELLPSSSVPYQNEVKYPNSDLYPIGMILLIDDIEHPLNIGFLNYINNDVCDEFIYHDGEYKVIRRVGIDSEGNKYALDNEFVDETGYIDLEVDTNSVIRLKSFDNGIYKATYLLDNQYTDVFATKVELSSNITQTAESINLNVNRKLENYSTTNEMNAAIDVKADEINSVVSTKVGDDEVISKINQSAEQIQINANKISLNGKTINMTSDNVAINSNNFSVDSSGNLSCSNATITGGNINMTSNHTNPKVKLTGTAYGGASCVNNLVADGMKIRTGNTDCIYLWVQKLESGGSSGYAGVLDINNTIDGRYATMDYDGFATGSNGTPRAYMYSDGEVHATTYTGGSLESIKKNIEIYKDSALKTILDTDIYNYNLKTEEDNEKKHIGLVIGNGKKSYKTPKNIISKSGDGIDLYSMISLSWKAIQEQQEIIENLNERIKKIEESDK